MKLLRKFYPSIKNRKTVFSFKIDFSPKLYPPSPTPAESSEKF